MQSPAATPFQNNHTRAMLKKSRQRTANPLLPGARPGARSNFNMGPSSNSKTTHRHCVDRGAIPRGSTIIYQNSAKALRATHAAGIGERSVQVRLADLRKSKRTSVPPPIGNRTDPHSCGLWSMSTGFRHFSPKKRSRSSMYRAPRFERGGCRRNSCREHHSLPTTQLNYYHARFPRPGGPRNYCGHSRTQSASSEALHDH